MRFATLFLVACASPATVDIYVTPEESVRGLETDDGWTVEYTKFGVTIGDFKAQSSAGGQSLHDENQYELDLLSSESIAVVTWKDAVPDIRYDLFGYSIFSLSIAGRITKGDVSKRFAWFFTGATRYDNCGAEGGQGGFATTAGSATTVEPTLHGDHWFFTNFAHATTPQRKADWIALCDDDQNGDVTLDELAAHDATDLFTPTNGYDLDSLPIQPILTAFDFFASQARTLGHYQGDGECEDISVIR